MLNNLKDFISTFSKVSSTPQGKWNENIFKAHKPFIIDELYHAILSEKVLNKGPKPKYDTINRFLDALFELLDSGCKYTYLFRHHNISRASFYRYFDLLTSKQILEKFHSNLLKGAIMEDITVLDSSHIRSVKGSQGVYYGFKEKGKKAVKITLLASTNKVVYFHSLEPDNTSDIKAFTNLSNQYPSKQKIAVLADKGYIGQEFQANCLKNGFEIICPIKKLRNNHTSHYLTPFKKTLLKTHRCKVEHVFAQLKSYSSIQIKRVRTIEHFDCLVNLAILLTSIHNGIIKMGLTPKQLIKLKKTN